MYPRHCLTRPLRPRAADKYLLRVIRTGTTAPKAAGVIHGDFERGFIRAETISYDDYIAHDGEQGSKDAGKMRAEGKDYIVQDGDVLHFRFNV